MSRSPNMALKLIFYLFVSFFTLTVSQSISRGCQCRPACSHAPPSAPIVPITLDNCGPSPSPLPPINAPSLQAPLVNSPPMPLPARVPPTKTVANTCHCVKTVVKPQVVQQLINVPTIQRYIQTTHTPVVEQIHYHGIPINCPPYAPDPPEASPTPPVSCAATGSSSSKTLTPCSGAIAKPQALPTCLTLPAANPPTLPPLLLSLLSLLSAKASQPLAIPPCLPPTAPAPPALPSYLQLPPSPPTLPLCLTLPTPLPTPPCSPSPPATTPCLSLSPSLLSLLSKLA